MGNLYKDWIQPILIMAFFTSPLVLMAGDAEQWQIAHELLNVTHFDKLIDDSIDLSIEMIKKLDPTMSGYEAIIRSFYEKYMKSESLRQDVIDLYCKFFTKKELKEMVAFYKTATGQKIVEKFSEIMQSSLPQGILEMGKFFTEKELKEIAVFCSTATGQKVMKKFPELMQNSLEIAQGHVFQHIDELQEMLAEEQNNRRKLASVY